MLLRLPEEPVFRFSERVNGEMDMPELDVPDG